MPQFLPAWFRQDLSKFIQAAELRNLLKKQSINTVCAAAKCPNIGECFNKKTATFLILGDVCTRGCKFCAVKKEADNFTLADNPNEPKLIAETVEKLKMKYVVITSVTRDDLEDGGARAFADTARSIKALNSQVKIELLIPDFRLALNRTCSGLGLNLESLELIANLEVCVVGHNIEMAERLYPLFRPQSSYQNSLSVLKHLKLFNNSLLTKSSMMLGLGESEEEIFQTMKDLRRQDCDILYLGQYLRPSKSQVEVNNFVAPEDFLRYKDVALNLGFKQVEASPLARSSYRAQKALEVIK